MNTAVFVLVLSPLLIYLVAAFLERRRELAPSEFFLAAGQVSSFEFANSSIGYGFQIASVSMFLAWGYLYGFAALVNPLFWGIGIALFGCFLPRMVQYLGSGKTLHGYLGQQYTSRGLEVVASIVTLIGFLGTFVAELAWGSAVFQLFSPKPILVGAILTGVAIVITVYLVRAGQLSAMRTDQVQLVFTYAGFLSLAVVLAWAAANRGVIARANSFFLSGTLALCLAAMAIMMWRQMRFEQLHAGNEGFSVTRFVRPLLVAMVTIALLALVVNLLVAWPSTTELRTAVSAPCFFSLSQGPLNLLSLAILPLLWQFVDVTMWQRLASVQMPRNDAPSLSPREQLKPIRLGLQRFALESPVTWLFAVVIGMLLHHAPIGVGEESIWNAIGAIPVALRGAGGQLREPIGLVLSIVFGAAIVAAMLSTADSMLMGALAVFSLDLARPAKRLSDTAAACRQVVRIGRLGIVGFMMLGLGIIWLQLLTSTQVLPILLGAYSAQISLSPCVLGTLLLPPRSVSASWAIASVSAGVTGGGYATIVALTNPDWQLYAPLFALGASVPVYFAGVIISRVLSSRSAAI